MIIKCLHCPHQNGCYPVCERPILTQTSDSSAPSASSLAARVEELEKALRPFAGATPKKVGGVIDPCPTMVIEVYPEWLEAARAALKDSSHD